MDDDTTADDGFPPHDNREAIETLFVNDVVLIGIEIVPFLQQLQVDDVAWLSAAIVAEGVEYDDTGTSPLFAHYVTIPRGEAAAANQRNLATSSSM